MRKVFTVVCLLSILIAASCTKSKTTNPDPGSDFKFSSLTATDSVIKVNAFTTISASATGSGLSYKWTASYGTFIGSGSTVQWTVCHQDKFTINCQVTDQYNHSETKSIVVRSQN